MLIMEDFTNLKGKVFEQQSSNIMGGTTRQIVEALPVQKVVEMLENTPLKPLTGKLNENELKEKLIQLLEKEKEQ